MRRKDVNFLDIVVWYICFMKLEKIYFREIIYFGIGFLGGGKRKFEENLIVCLKM